MAMHPGWRNKSVEQQPYVASPPSFGSDKKGSDIVFAHREYVMDVKSSVDFKATTLPINPGNPKMFPWMSRIASLYEEYELLGLLFEYRSTSATAVGTTSSGMGVVVMATDYDCYDNNFTTKRQMEAAEFSSAAVPFETFLHPIECDPRRNVLNERYVVPGIVDYTDAKGDARLSVHGNFTIATEGQQTDDSTIGELWVTYHLRLSRPVLEASSATLYSAHSWGGVGSDGAVTISGTKVSNGWRPPVYVNTGSGTTNALQIKNTSCKLRGNYLINMVLSSSSNFEVFGSQPTNLAASFTPGCAVYKYFANQLQEQVNVRAEGAGQISIVKISDGETDLYTYTSAVAVSFDSDAGSVSIPVPYPNTGGIDMNINITITQLASDLRQDVAVSSYEGVTAPRTVRREEETVFVEQRTPAGKPVKR